MKKKHLLKAIEKAKQRVINERDLELLDYKQFKTIERLLEILFIEIENVNKSVLDTKF